MYEKYSIVIKQVIINDNKLGYLFSNTSYSSFEGCEWDGVNNDAPASRSNKRNRLVSD